MDLYEKIKELAAQKHVSIRQIEEHLGYGNGTIRRWSKQTPGVDKVTESPNTLMSVLIISLVTKKKAIIKNLSTLLL